MIKRSVGIFVGICWLMFGSIANGDEIFPQESCLNVNFGIYDAGPGCGFSDPNKVVNPDIADGIGTDGLGSLTVTVTGTETLTDFFVGMFVDWEIAEPFNTFFNEGAEAVGEPATGQSWEIDEPGFGSQFCEPLPPEEERPEGFELECDEYFGDIFDNFSWSSEDGSLLDNSAWSNSTTTIGDVANGPDSADPWPAWDGTDDASLALGWDFNLAVGERAIVSFLLSTAAPETGLYLRQYDPDAEFEFFFSSTLDIVPVAAVPEPGTLLLLAAGLLGISATRRRRSV